jgi:hypothetical protein
LSAAVAAGSDQDREGCCVIVSGIEGENENILLAGVEVKMRPWRLLACVCVDWGMECVCVCVIRPC